MGVYAIIVVVVSIVTGRVDQTPPCGVVGVQLLDIPCGIVVAPPPSSPY